ncbi:hypothetical protein HZH68_008533 [Vespula germanica]|uniref:Uncharacterized protein n=1 Tax=Vespula germanica TaxID=30212 RepID=A0A834JZH8_VESGE|nr:hypothetical protein HZH68_008533 [Vespula germanica]
MMATNIVMSSLGRRFKEGCVFTRTTLVGWLVRWLVGWLVGWLIRWLVGWLVGKDLTLNRFQNTTSCTCILHKPLLSYQFDVSPVLELLDIACERMKEKKKMQKQEEQEEQQQQQQ